jgi:hypothetical protein
MWLAGTPTRVIAETLKISADRCDVTRRRLGLPRRESWHNAKRGVRKAYLPTPEEIRRKCLEFQAGWSDEERAKRLVGGPQNPPPVEIRVIPDSLISGGGFDDGCMTIEDLADTSGGLL